VPNTISAGAQIEAMWLTPSTLQRWNQSIEEGGDGYVPTDFGYFSTFRSCRPRMISSPGLSRKVVATSALGCAGTPWEGLVLAV